MAFGRNPFGQLGLPDTKLCENPTIIPTLENVNVVQAAVGRHHSLFLTDTGRVYACGENKSGQCGIGNTSPTVPTPTLINYRGPPIIRVGCGADFSVILDIKGNLHTFGLPEYGQLGHNTDAKYFVNANKLSYHFESSPKKIVLYIEKSKEGHVTPVDNVQIVDFACGNNHTVSQEFCFSIYCCIHSNASFFVCMFRLQSIPRNAFIVGVLLDLVAWVILRLKMRWYHVL